MNDGVSEDLCSLRYPSFDVVAKHLLQLGPGAQMSKLDIKEPYRMVPVHREDWLLLGMQWRGAYYLDTRLPFGLRSAPKIFTAVADALQWIMLANGITSFIHYLEDFFFVEPPGLGGAALSRALALWKSLGVPVAPNKVEGPSTTICFLGLELDSSTLTARLPADKLARLQQLMADWGDKKVCRKRDLLSLIGVLQHATAVVRYGRCFLRYMIDLAARTEQLHHHIRLNREFRSDLSWWSTFAPHWNGCSLLTPAFLSTPDVVVHTDASGSWVLEVSRLRAGSRARGQRIGKPKTSLPKSFCLSCLLQARGAPPGRGRLLSSSVTTWPLWEPLLHGAARSH